MVFQSLPHLLLKEKKRRSPRNYPLIEKREKAKIEKKKDLREDLKEKNVLLRMNVGLVEKKGHVSHQCPRNNKKRKKIILLGIDEETKQKLCYILKEKESKFEDSSEEEKCSDEEFINDANNFNIDSEYSEIDCNNQGIFCYCDSKSISVLLENTVETLFTTIEHIKDDEAK